MAPETSNSYALTSGGRARSMTLNCEFEYLQSDAQLNFDMGFKKRSGYCRNLSMQVPECRCRCFRGRHISPSLEGEEMGVDLPGFKKGDRTRH